MPPTIYRRSLNGLAAVEAAVVPAEAEEPRLVAVLAREEEGAARAVQAPAVRPAAKVARAARVEMGAEVARAEMGEEVEVLPWELRRIRTETRTTRSRG